MIYPQLICSAGVPDPRCAMLLQLADPDDIFIVNSVVKIASQHITAAHIAFREGLLEDEHIQWAHKIRSDLGQLLALFEDKTHGRMEPEMLNAMRLLEASAHKFLCCLDDTDYVRQAAA